MSKTIVSPVAKFPGSVTIADPMTLPQAIALERAWRAAQAIDRETATLAEMHQAWLPGLCACVEKWELEGFDQLAPDTFPATPRSASGELVAWLIKEVTAVYGGEDDTPNA